MIMVVFGGDGVAVGGVVLKEGSSLLGLSVRNCSGWAPGKKAHPELAQTGSCLLAVIMVSVHPETRS